MKIALLIPLFLIVGNIHLLAKTWETASEGFWENASTWIGEELPNYTSSDTFIIHHPIVINENLSFESGADVFIDSLGGICGHQTLSLLSNAVITSYGILELDTLNINGGQAYFHGGFVILTEYGIVSGTGGFLQNTGASLDVGPWFECLMPYYSFLTSEPDIVSLEDKIKIYPNPTHHYLMIELHQNNEKTNITVSDIQGKIIFNQKELQENIIKIDLSKEAAGWYIVIIERNNSVHYHKIHKYNR